MSRSSPKANKILIACMSLAGLSQPASAFTFGNISVRSFLGESFNAQVDVSFNKAEDVDESCFHLIPNRNAPDVAALPSARLTFTPYSSKDSLKGTLSIRSNAPISEPTVQVTLEASCPSIGKIQREYVVLLDPPALSVPLATATSIEHLGKSKSTRAAKSTGNSKGKKNAKADKSANSAGIFADEHPPKEKERPRNKSHTRQQQALVPRAPTTTGGFRLKLSAPEIDLSHIVSMTEQERAAMRERQLLMDSDDYISSLLESKSKLKELEGRLAELQSKVGAAPASGNAQQPSDPTAANTPATPAAHTPSGATTPPAMPQVLNLQAANSPRKPPTVLESESKLGQMAKQWYWWVIGLLTSALLFVMMRRRESSYEPVPQYNLKEDVKPTTAPNTKAPNTKAPNTKAPITKAKAEQDPAAFTPAPPASLEPTKTSPRDVYRNVIVDQFPELKAAGNIDARTIIGVAWQYFEDKGERGRAIELIEFGLEEHPDVDELWLTQFEFLLRDRRVEPYEQLAKRYRQRFPEDHSWIKIQSWIQIQSGGRFLDPENPLYAVEAIADSQTKVLTLDFEVANKKPGEADSEPSPIAKQ